MSLLESKQHDQAPITRRDGVSRRFTGTITNLQSRGNFFSGGVAGYSIYTGGSGGKEHVFFGNPGTKARTWGLWVSDDSTLTTPNTTVPNTATFTYNAVTGAATLSLSAGSPAGLVLSKTVSPGLAIDSLRIHTNNGGDLKFGTITAKALAVSPNRDP